MTEYTSADIVKSMKLFFIDNQGAWPAHKDGTCKAELVGDLVLYPDDGKYPNYVPVACATHPNFDGTIVVQAGTRGLLVSFVSDATPEDNLKERFRTMKGIEQYRVAIDAVVHRIVLHLAQRNEGTVTSEVDPLSLVAWMAASDKGRGAAHVILSALKLLMKDVGALKLTDDYLKITKNGGNAFDICDALMTSIQQAVAARAAQATAAPVVRRK